MGSQSKVKLSIGAHDGGKTLNCQHHYCGIIVTMMTPGSTLHKLAGERPCGMWGCSGSCNQFGLASM